MSWWRRQLTPGEIEERDAKARARMKRREDKENARNAAAKASHQGASRMERAAGISKVTIVCHRDTWRYIHANCADRTGWVNSQSLVTRDDGLLQVTLSGYQLTYVLMVMGESSTFMPHISRAMHHRIYSKVAEIVDQVDPDTSEGIPVPPIVIDAKISAD